MPDVIMPRLTDSMQEGAIAKWLKADGDEVRRGEELVEIETDKATMAYEADFDGALRIVVAEGETVPVGTVIGQIGKAVAVGAVPGEGGSAAAATEPATAAGAVPVAANGGDGARRRPRKPGASPLARRIAERLGVDLASISGSGAHGRILKLDVVAAADRGSTAAPAGSDGERQPLNRTQSIVARRMSESRQTIPDFALGVDVDMSECLRMRSELKALADPAPSLNDLIVKACALALRRHPRANGSFTEDGFELHPRVNVAVAVAAEDALVAPVVADADRKTVGQIAADTRRLIEAVRGGHIAPADLEGGTFTVSNLGMYGIDRFEGIINPPQAAILCVGAVADRPVAVDGELAIRPIVSMTLASDHRILYGADAAAFLSDVRRLLERPLGMAL
ncbi:MAG TPA: dihydrolipoamide acetyltransferase family protein [Solirubrobacteraceae bacterium]|nr:dihydrolipoamide acetyltransferase family protein [Solirubrobacteraceae bacterium]